MSFKVEIACDDGRGNPLHKRTCASRGMRPDNPTGAGITLDKAHRAAEQAAALRGWKKRRRPGRAPPTQWLCGSCQP